MKQKILVIDNNRIILNFMKRLLEKEGHEVATAEDGLLAINILDDFQPDIIFSDLIMPNIEGDKLCEIVRSNSSHNNCYLVIMSAAAVEINLEDVDISADAFIAKGPFNEMSKNILEVIKRHGHHADAAKTKPVLGIDSLYPRQMTRELLSRHDHFKTVMDSIAEGILEITAGKVVYANRTAAGFFGLGQEKLLSRAPEELFDPEAADRIRRLLAADIGAMVEIDAKNPLKLAQKKVALKCLPVNGENTRVLMLTDVTERVAAEQELRRYRNHLEQLVDERTTELSRTMARLQQAQRLEAIGTLAGGVAHDLNNILSGIISYPELLLLQLEPGSPLEKPLKTIKKSGHKATAIVQDLLALARRSVSVSEVIMPNQIILAYLESPEFEKLRMHHPGLEVRTELAPGLPPILGSIVHLSKALMNLVSNAAEAMPTGGVLTISTQVQYLDSPVDGCPDMRVGEYVNITVADTGIGISANHITKIFEPFYTKKEMGRSGTGLGMAVVWGTVKDHKGYIDVKSTPGEGTAFNLYFPPTQRVPEKKPEALSINRLRGNGESILVVDDMPEQLEITGGMLTELGYRTDTVSSGEAAADYLQSHTVDLLILDMIMPPGIDGLDTYRRITRRQPGQKTILISGFSETERIRTAQALGAGQFIRKPFSIQDLGLGVKKALQAGPGDS